MKFITLEAYDRLNRAYYLNRALSEYKTLSESHVSVSSIILEDNDAHHYEWDFTTNKFYDRINNIETDIKKSASFVRTVDQGIDFIKELSAKVAELPDKIKSDFAKVAVGAMALTMSVTQLNQLNSEVKEKKIDPVVKGAVVANIKKVETAKTKAVEITKPKYETDSSQPYSERLVDFLKNEEGDAEYKGEPKTTAYAIGDGMVTIGYGHAEPVTKTVKVKGEKKRRSENYIEDVTSITKAEADDLLIKDIAENARYIMHYIVNDWDEKGTGIKITQPMFDAMVSISFNHGIGNLLKSPFLKALRNGDLNSATEAIKKLGVSDKFGGITKRRQKEMEMFKGSYPM
jgi:GH24 family phage-related lysozyme (muramidase)